MKKITIIFLTILFSYNLVVAQDTLYIYKSGSVVTKRAVSDIDSITFQKAEIIVGPIIDINDSITDIDGNVYHSVKIGNQEWLVENLKTTRFNDGTSIPLVTDDKNWTDTSSPGFCYYNNNAVNKGKYGALYNWYAANTGKLAPIGWHIPTNAEWTTLENFLIANGYNYDGTTTDNKIAKSLAAKTDWPNITIELQDGAIGIDLTKNNSSGFTALPAGYRSDDASFNNIGYLTYLCSITYNGDGQWPRFLYCNSNYLSADRKREQFGVSVRCVRNN